MCLTQTWRSPRCAPAGQARPVVASLSPVVALKRCPDLSVSSRQTHEPTQHLKSWPQTHMNENRIYSKFLLSLINHRRWGGPMLISPEPLGRPPWGRRACQPVWLKCCRRSEREQGGVGRAHKAHPDRHHGQMHAGALTGAKQGAPARCLTRTPNYLMPAHGTHAAKVVLALYCAAILSLLPPGRLCLPCCMLRHR